MLVGSIVIGGLAILLITLLTYRYGAKGHHGAPTPKTAPSPKVGLGEYLLWMARHAFPNVDALMVIVAYVVMLILMFIVPEADFFRKAWVDTPMLFIAINLFVVGVLYTLWKISNWGKIAITLIAGATVLFPTYWYVARTYPAWDVATWVPKEWRDGNFTLASLGLTSVRNPPGVCGDFGYAKGRCERIFIASPEPTTVHIPREHCIDLNPKLRQKIESGELIVEVGSTGSYRIWDPRDGGFDESAIQFRSKTDSKIEVAFIIDRFGSEECVELGFK